jgi:glycosyltransferase involved in cell wall biosynthesis
MKKLAIIASHPVQYNAPWFRLLEMSGKIRVKVFYTWSQVQQGPKFDPGFGKVVEWDIPLLEGYEYTFVKNTSNSPGTHHFNGIVNPSLIKDIEAWLPDAVLVIGWSFHSHLKCIRFFHKKKLLLFRGDSTLLNNRPGLKSLLRKISLKWVYSHIDYALYVGTHNRNYYLEYGLKERQLVYAPHAIDNDRFANFSVIDKRKSAQWRFDLGIDEEDFVVLFVGKLEPVKNPVYILELARHFQDKQVKFVFVGGGILESELKLKAGENKRIIFIDFQNQTRMPMVYRLGNVFILPSASETWGLAINEAMACGLPVIASSKVGASIDLIKQNNGIIFKPGDINATINYIKRMLDNVDEYQQQCAASRLIIKDYCFSRIVESIEQVVISNVK